MSSLWYLQWHKIFNLAQLPDRLARYLILRDIYLASLIAQLVKNPPSMQETPVWFLAQEICWRRDRLPTPVFLVSPCGSAGKESAHDEGDLGWEDSLEKGKVTRSSVLAWRIPWTVWSMGHKESDTTEWLSLSCLPIPNKWYIL